jgi:DNA (cytosine-5)-methyltransferase 1
MALALYNEIDPKAAAWLRELIEGGHIAPGIVDERDIRDIRPEELDQFTQCHFFAGIGGWSLALRLAGWTDDRPVWTGSCPCQPFSAAGKRAGTDDERHLWPFWHWHIKQCQPVAILGEQVASKDGLGWLDLVCADLEGSGYAVRAEDRCAAGAGAPHIRQRLWFGAERVADAERHGQHRRWDGRPGRRDELPDGGATGGLEHGPSDGRIEGRTEPSGRGAASRRGLGRLADRHQSGLEGRPGVPGGAAERAAWPGGMAQPEPFASALDGFWRDADWLLCRDGKWRPVEPGTFPLAHGLPARVGLLRGYGNAIVPQVAAQFIRDWQEPVEVIEHAWPDLVAIMEAAE